MKISESHKFAHIHIPRTGGTSLSQALIKYSRQVNPEHGYLQELARKYPVNEYFKFSFVRNPWDWEWSIYCHRQQKHNLGETFEDFLKMRRERSVQMVDYLTIDGIVSMDFIGRFETLEQDCQTIFSKIGITETIPHLRKIDKPLYKSGYTPRLQDMVRRMHLDDIREFGYTFEGIK